MLLFEIIHVFGNSLFLISSRGVKVKAFLSKLVGLLIGEQHTRQQEPQEKQTERRRTSLIGGCLNNFISFHLRNTTQLLYGGGSKTKIKLSIYNSANSKKSNPQGKIFKL